jgi:hypothetical protein
MPWKTTDDATHHDDNTGKSLAGWRNETIDLHCTQGLVMDYGVWTASGDWGFLSDHCATSTDGSIKMMPPYWMWRGFGPGNA